MKKGTIVSWQVKGAATRGQGTIISFDDETQTALVRVDTLMGEPFPGYHQVIHCTSTWLTVEPQPGL